MVEKNFLVDPGFIGVLFNVQTTGNTIINNTIVGSSEACLRLSEQATGQVPYFDVFLMKNMIATGNVFACKTTACRNFVLLNHNSNNSFNPFTTLNGNHYVQPYTTNVNARTINGGGAYTQLPLATWKTYTGLDATATQYSNYKVTPAAGDVMTEFNATDSPVIFNIPALHTDVYGNAPSNPYTIQPFEGMIYLKQ